MKIERCFTSKNRDDFLDASFKLVSNHLRPNEGVSLLNVNNVEVPVKWSQVSIDVLVQKYFRKQDVPVITKRVAEKDIPIWLQRSEADLLALEEIPEGLRFNAENSAKQVFHRIAGAWTYWGFKNKYFSSEEDARTFFEEIQYLLCHQIASPSSLQWLNTGLHWAYGITGKERESYFFDEEKNSVNSINSIYERPQVNTCFIQGVRDSLIGQDGLASLITKEATLFKYGSGTGSNFSKIRGKGETVSLIGNSSGVMSFLRVADSSAGSVKSGGIARRSTKIALLDMDHPEIEDFINWKVTEEKKVVSLVTGSIITYKSLQNILNACKNYENKEHQFDIKHNIKLKSALQIAKGLMVPEKYIQRTFLLAKQGFFDLDFNVFSTGWDSESYYTVSGQNTNNAISVSNEFLNKVANNETWELVNRLNKKVAKVVNANELWSKATYAAWSCGDPLVYFNTTINEWHTCPNEGKIEATTPSSEYMFLNDTACNFASINLLSFRKEDGTFDTEKYKHIIRLLIISLDISTTMTHFPTKKSAHLSYKFRPLGLGYVNMGSYLMSIGIAYDSDEGRSICSALTALLSGYSYATSAELAKVRGAFLGFEQNKEDMLRVIRNHKRACYNEANSTYENLSVFPTPLKEESCIDTKLLREAKKSWEVALDKGMKYGYRNAQVTCIAPTGTTSLLMDSATVGIEPDFALVKYVNLTSGGYFKIVNPNVPLALEKLGYSENQIKDIENYMIGHKTLKNAPKINHKTLKNKGFRQKEIDKIEETLKNIYNIEFAFNQYILGEDFCKDILKIDLEKLKNPNLSLLQSIGFSKEDIIEANIYVTGALTIEGAPHILNEHLSVFDCSMLCGSIGTRCLSYESHIKMLATAQAFISGGIAKTITLPDSSTIEDFHNAYMLSWNMGVKSSALYRDGSKLSQPITTKLLPDEDVNDNFLDDIFNEKISNNEKLSTYDKISELSKDIAYNLVRKKSYEKKISYSKEVRINKIHDISLQTTEYKNGSLAEIFIDLPKETVLVRNLANAFATAISIGLQYGIPIEEFVNSFILTKFYPCGEVSFNPEIKDTTSIIDYIFKDLSNQYIDSYDTTNNYNNNKENIRKKDQERQICPNCHSITVVISGNGLLCNTCGKTTSCS